MPKVDDKEDEDDLAELRRGHGTTAWRRKKGDSGARALEAILNVDGGCALCGTLCSAAVAVAAINGQTTFQHPAERELGCANGLRQRGPRQCRFRRHLHNRRQHLSHPARFRPTRGLTCHTIKMSFPGGRSDLRSMVSSSSRGERVQIRPHRPPATLCQKTRAVPGHGDTTGR